MKIIFVFSLVILTCSAIPTFGTAKKNSQQSTASHHGAPVGAMRMRRAIEEATTTTMKPEVTTKCEDGDKTSHSKSEGKELDIIVKEADSKQVAEDKTGKISIADDTDTVTKGEHDEIKKDGDKPDETVVEDLMATKLDTKKDNKNEALHDHSMGKDCDHVSHGKEEKLKINTRDAEAKDDKKTTVEGDKKALEVSPTTPTDKTNPEANTTKVSPAPADKVSPSEESTAPEDSLTKGITDEVLDILKSTKKEHSPVEESKTIKSDGKSTDDKDKLLATRSVGNHDHMMMPANHEMTHGDQQMRHDMSNGHSHPMSHDNVQPDMPNQMRHDMHNNPKGHHPSQHHMPKGHFRSGSSHPHNKNPQNSQPLNMNQGQDHPHNMHKRSTASLFDESGYAAAPATVVADSGDSSYESAPVRSAVRHAVRSSYSDNSGDDVRPVKLRVKAKVRMTPVRDSEYDAAPVSVRAIVKESSGYNSAPVAVRARAVVRSSSSYDDSPAPVAVRSVVRSSSGRYKRSTKSVRASSSYKGSSTPIRRAVVRSSSYSNSKPVRAVVRSPSYSDSKPVHSIDRSSRHARSTSTKTDDHMTDEHTSTKSHRKPVMKPVSDVVKSKSTTADEDFEEVTGDIKIKNLLSASKKVSKRSIFAM